MLAVRPDLPVRMRPGRTSEQREVLKEQVAASLELLGDTDNNAVSPDVRIRHYGFLDNEDGSKVYHVISCFESMCHQGRSAILTSS